MAALVASIAITSLYRVAREEERGRLVELARSQAELIEAVTAFEIAGGGAAESPTASVPEYMATAHALYDPAARSGELQNGQESGDRIVFFTDEDCGGNDVPRVTRIAADTIERGGCTCIRIVLPDNGIGIPKESILPAFDPFSATGPRGCGTGLDLSVGHGIVRERQGTLYAESAAGEFTRFAVDLPAADAGRGGGDVDDRR